MEPYKFEKGSLEPYKLEKGSGPWYLGFNLSALYRTHGVMPLL
jgi:hypothetical protein